MTMTEAVNKLIEYKKAVCKSHTDCCLCPLIDECAYINSYALRSIAERYDEEHNDHDT